MNDNGSILVVNAASSSLRFSVFRGGPSDTLQPAAHGQIDGARARPAGAPLVERDYSVAEGAGVPDAIRLAGAWLREQFPDEPLRAVGHRVVNGGTDYAHPMQVDDSVFAALQALIQLAPLIRTRAQACSLDADANTRGGPRISAADCAVSAWVIATNEELMIARHTYERVPGQEARHAG